MFVIHLLLLIAAFLGVDLDDPLTPVANTCAANWTGGFEEVPKGHYSENWYAWESCLLGPDRPEALPVSVADAKKLIAEEWAEYLSWTEAVFSDALGLSPSSVKGKIKPPTLHVGQAAIDKHCDGDAAGCAAGFDFRASRRGGTLRLDSYTPGKIVIPEVDAPEGSTGQHVGLYYLLHELAHAIDGHQWTRWADDPDPEPGTAAFEDERTNGHGLSFRCLALDLYHIRGDVSDELYTPLASLCALYYAG